MKALTTHSSIPELQKQLEDALYRARTELNRYQSEYDKLNAKVQHANEMRDLLITAVEAMSTQPDEKGSLSIHTERGQRKLGEKKPVRVGNILFYLDQDFRGELEALQEVVESCKKRVFLLEKAVEALGRLKPGREKSLRVVDEDGIPVKVLVRN